MTAGGSGTPAYVSVLVAVCVFAVSTTFTVAGLCLDGAVNVSDVADSTVGVTDWESNVNEVTTDWFEAFMKFVPVTVTVTVPLPSGTVDGDIPVIVGAAPCAATGPGVAT